MVNKNLPFSQSEGNGGSSDSSVYLPSSGLSSSSSTDDSESESRRGLSEEESDNPERGTSDEVLRTEPVVSGARLA